MSASARLLFALTLLATSVILTTPKTAEALPGPGCSCEYFSTSSHQTLVGERTLDCAGNVVDPTWGSRTAWSNCSCDPC